MTHVGFAEIDITPPLGTAKIGMLRHLTIERVRDPIYARAAVFEGEGPPIGFIQLDTLSVRWSTTDAIRQRIEAELDFLGAHVMVSATHNHAGPAVANVGDVKRDETYLATLIDRCVEVFAEAQRRRRPAQLGFAHKEVFGLSFNRRVVMRDGTTRTQHRFQKQPGGLYIEGPMDPELAVLAARDAQSGVLLGAMVNFTCHPTFYGADDTVSASWPGVLASALKAQGCPVTMLLNGAAGDIHHMDPTGQVDLTADTLGEGLAGHTAALLAQMAYRTKPARLTVESTTLSLPYREPTDDQVRGSAHGAQRFIDSAIYDRHMPALLERIRTRGSQPAEIQMLGIDELAFVAIPAEYFCQLGLNIKERAHPRHALIAGFANGMIGYVPTAAAFERGGYETTFAASSRMAPETGELIAEAALKLMGE